MKTIHAVYEDGVFRPTEPVDLPEGAAVAFEPRVESETAPTPTTSTILSMSPGLAKVYAILSERYASGHTDTAERHNEHQP